MPSGKLPREDATVQNYPAPPTSRTSGRRWSGIPRSADGLIERYLTTPPDIPVEILSPGQVLKDEQDKFRWYVANGVPIAVFVHPPSRTVTHFTPTTERRVSADDPIDLEAVLPGCTLTVAALFATLRID